MDCKHFQLQLVEMRKKKTPSSKEIITFENMTLYKKII